MVIFPLLGVSREKSCCTYGDLHISIYGRIFPCLDSNDYLHSRIALRLIRLTAPAATEFLGFMLSTASSAWISNTATAIMMLPIAASVTSLLAKEAGRK